MLNIHRFSLVFLGVLLWSTLGLAQQRHLSLYSAKGNLAKRYYEGDVLQFKTERGWQSMYIEKLEHDTVFFTEAKLHLSAITAVRVVKAGRSGTGSTLIVGGILWPAIVTINGLTSDSRPLLTTRSLITTAVLLGGGGLLIASAVRTYATTESGRLRIMNFDFTTPQQPPNDEPNP